MTAFRTFVIAPPLGEPECTPSGQLAVRDGVLGIPGYTCLMPTYEYECTVCGQHIEVFQRFSEDPLTTCGVCGGKLRKVFHPAGIVFKGSGFYATDSRAKASSGAASSKDSDGGSSSSGATSSSDSSPDSGGGSTSKGGGGSSSKGSNGGKASTTGSKKETSSS
jgi:putative FmdB family regulatory protein